jgi:eukaryotic-like serine/threonine-protein kinase
MLQTSPSTIIGGRYELQRELARGGMGSVWVAKDRKLRRAVAIKVMVPMWADSVDATTRFEREAMAVAQLQSPHVVQIFDYGIEEGCPYIVMELLEGEDLRGRLQRQERLDLDTAGKVLVQTAKALSAAHAAGIVHRDLKPGNIFLAKSRDEEIVKVLDFGVAKFDQDATGAAKDTKDEKTKAGTLLGTPQYMSPEQARGLPNIDQRADLWSLAVIIYRALVGRLPFTGKSAADVIVKICTQEPAKPTTLAPDLPAEVDRFFKRAFARNLNERFESARQMAVAFSRIAPTSFPSLSMPEPMPEIADALRDRQLADAGMDWDDDEAPAAPAGVPGGALAAGAPGLGSAAGDGPTGPGRPAGGVDVFGTPLAPPSGTLSASTLNSAVSAPGEPLSSSVSGGTLPSGLVDATPAAGSRAKRRSTKVWGIALGAVVVGIIAVVLVGGTLLRSGTDTHPAGSPSGAGPAAGLGTGTGQPGAGATGQPGGATAQDAGAAAANGSSETQPFEEFPPDRISPGKGGSRGSKPTSKGTATATAHTVAPPPPPPTGGDPFSERL